MDKELKPGKRYNLNGDIIVIVGRNPLTNKWVAACNDWCLIISELEREDLNDLEPV